MNALTKAPSAWQIGRVLEIVREMRERHAAEPGAVETDDDDIRRAWDWDEAPSAIDPEDVMRRLVRAANEADSMDEAIERRLDDLRARQDRYAKRRKEYRASIALVMGALSIDKFTDADATVSLRPNKGGAVIITDEDALPDEYMRVSRSPDRTKIRADLTAGVVVAGATLSQGGEAILTIRSK